MAHTQGVYRGPGSSLQRLRCAHFCNAKVCFWCYLFAGPASFYALRLALGITEAGAFPAMWHVCGQVRLTDRSWDEGAPYGLEAAVCLSLSLAYLLCFGALCCVRACTMPSLKNTQYSHWGYDCDVAPVACCCVISSLLFCPVLSAVLPIQSHHSSLLSY